MNSILFSTASRLFFALLVIFSLFMLLRGHNQPGGGFIGGLIAAAAYIIIVFAEGTDAARRALRLDPRSIAVAGVGVVLISGLAPALIKTDPFTGIWFQLLGLPLSNILLFDIGVYLAVFGAMLTLVFALEDLT